MNIILHEPGTYHLQDIVSQSKAINAAGVDESLTAALSTLLGPGVQTEGTTAGIRSANAGARDSGPWYSSEARVYLDAGRSYIKSRQYRKAIAQFRDGLQNAEPAEASTLRFYLACAFYLDGQTVEAWKELSSLKADRAAGWNKDFVLLKGRLLFDGYAFKRAVAWLLANKQELSGDRKRAAMYYLLLGASYRGLGDRQVASSDLEKVTSLGGNSAVAQAALTLLKEP